MSSSTFKRGFHAALPGALGVFTFGVIAGVATLGAGFSPWAAFAMSVVMYAGSAQLVVVQMLTGGTPAAVAFLANLIVNLRFILYSVTMRPHLGGLVGWRRVWGSYILSDHSFALSIGRLAHHPPDREQADYFLGTSAAVWISWQLGSIVGIVAGTRIPAELGLEFIVTLVFLAMAVSNVKSAPQALAGLASSVVAVLAWGLPFKLGILLAAAAGIAVGLAAERREAG